MGIANSISRLTAYYTRHGFGATIQRASLAAKRTFFSGRMVVFYFDLDERRLPPVNMPKSLGVERLKTPAELSAEHLQEMTSFWNPKLAGRNVEERFGKGASLWLIKSEERLAGYGWTLQGRTMEPYFFPLGKLDVHLFDFHVFSQYRGRGLNPLLVNHILHNLATEGACHAFIEAAEWNQPQLSSLRKTPFQRLGLARSFTIFGHKFISWAESKTQQPTPEGAEPSTKALTIEKSHE